MAIRVRGDCPKCKKTVTTDAPRNRATWRGRCPVTDGCDGIVMARRIKAAAPAGDDQADATTDQPPAAPAKPGRRSTIPKVSYDRAARRAAADVPPAGTPTGQPAGEQPPHRDDDPGPDAAEQPHRQPTRADRVESGPAGRRPYAHLGY